MKYIFTLMTRISLRFRAITVISIFVLMALGAIAIDQLKQELLPPIEFPQTIVLGQVSGMDSEEVLSVLTERIEAALLEGGENGDGIEEIINLDSQTTGSFGTVLIAYNDFGIDTVKLRANIQDALDTVWLPLRSIEAPNGTDEQEFAVDLLGDLTPDILLYIAGDSSNFLFQLSPEVWNALPEATVREAAAYLAQETDVPTGEESALERLVEKEILPQIRSLDGIANVAIDGGQALPGEEDIFGETIQETGEKSLLLRISPDAWEVISAKLGGLGELDQDAVDALAETEVNMPAIDAPPALPESWQAFDRFSDATDLLEIGTLTKPVAEALNDFYETGKIVGALGQTDDLTVEVVQNMLAIQPTMIRHFEADHLLAMAQDVLDVVLADEQYVANLDGFTRDALAARALAQSVVQDNNDSSELVRTPVELPEAWRLQPPQIITFSAADIPLASFSVSTKGLVLTDEPAAAQDDAQEDDSTNDGSDDTATSDDDPGLVDTDNGPALNPQWGLAAVMLNSQLDMQMELDTADDFFALANAFGGNVADVLNGILSAEEAMIMAPGLLGNLPVDAVEYILDEDATAMTGLNPAVWGFLPEEVQALVPLGLGQAWDLLASQPQFADAPLTDLDDLLATGNGSAASVLNTINAGTPEQFAGYEVRLFDSLTPEMISYLLREEPDFYETLDIDVLLKFSPDVLALLPEDFLEDLSDRDAESADTVVAIATGEQNSAAAEISERYATNVPDGDPNAPALNPDWGALESRYNVELDSADDFFRFPEGYAYEDAAALINSVFESPQGANYAPQLLGNMPLDAMEYIVNRDASVMDNLIPRALRLLPPDVLALLPEALQDRATEGEEFVPESSVTRTNGQPSLFITVFKDSDANTVSTYHDVKDLLDDIDAADENINVGIVFEQSTFVEESISGVAREGGLGAVFAVIIILLFLSSGVWSSHGRRRVGVILIIVFLALLVGLTALGLEDADNDWGEAFANADIVFRVLLIGGVLSGFAVLFWPGDLPDPAYRATLVIAISIPLSILMAFIGMRWVSPAMYKVIQPLAEDSSFFAFILRLFPEELSLNIMTLSGLTVAVGRVVDDSIVVLENIFRQLESGEITEENKRAAVIYGTRDVSAAIFIATVVAVVVFLPLGLTGGIVGAFFLPFGLAVTYALAASFLVAVTFVPVLAFLFINANEIPDEGDIWIAHYYLPILRWALRNWKTKATVIVLAVASMVFGFYLFGQRPASFLPDMGEPQIAVEVEMPSSTRILELNVFVAQMEAYLTNPENIPQEQVRALEVIVGGGGAGFESLILGNSVAENRASLTLGLDASVSPDEVDELTQQIREVAELMFNCPMQAEGNCGEDNVTVSSASIASEGMGGFELVLSGPEEEINKLDLLVIETLSEIEGIANVTSNRTEDPTAEMTEEDPERTIIRVNQKSALSYAGELETQDTIGMIQEAVAAIEGLPEIQAVPGVEVSQGFASQMQTEGFNNMPIAMGIALLIVIITLIATFQSAVYWFALISSIFVAPVGAAVALTLADRVLGISALIGLLMLLGLVITNAVVLLDRVRSNRTERGLDLYDALVEAGGRRLRPILMTSLATIIALIPLAIGLSEGAIIASELGTVVIGGVVSSTLLTLIVVPVMYSLLTPLHRLLSFSRGQSDKAKTGVVDDN